MPDLPSSYVFREFTRTPIRADVHLRFDSDEDFVGESANLSAGGMFVAASEPRPVGTLVRFAIQVPHLETSIKGFGEVVWIRVRYVARDRPKGMGIQFRHLEEPGQESLLGMLRGMGALSGDDSTVSDLPSGARLRRPQAQKLEEGEETVDERGGEAPADGTRGEAGAGAPLAADVSPSGFPPPSPAGSHRLEDTAAAGAVAADLDRPSRAAPAEQAAEPPRQPSATARTAYGAAVARPQAQPSRRRLAIAGAAVVLLLALAFVARDRLGGWLSGGGAPSPARRTSAPVDRSMSRSATSALTAPQPSVPDARSSPETAGAGEEAGVEKDATPTQPPPVPSTGESTAPPSPPAPSAPRPASRPPLKRLLGIDIEGDAGGTLVTLRGDGAFSPERLTQQRIEGRHPRELLRISGIDEGFELAEIGGGTPELLRVRTGLHAGATGSELHVVLDLSGPEIVLSSIEPDGESLRIRLNHR